MAEVKKENWFVRTWGKVAKYFRELRSELKMICLPCSRASLISCLTQSSSFTHLSIEWAESTSMKTLEFFIAVLICSPKTPSVSSS